MRMVLKHVGVAALVAVAHLGIFLALSAVVAGATTPSGPEKVVSGLMSSWNAKDARAFASEFTESATFVNVNGTIWIGNKEIEKRLANTEAFKTSHAEIKPESLRFLRRDLALVHAAWTITGDPRSPQARSYLMTLVVSKRNDRWLIFAAQNGSSFDHSVLSATKYQPAGLLPTSVPEDGEMRKLFTELDDNWNRSDAAGISRLFAGESDLVDISVHRFSGREEIEKDIADLLLNSLEGMQSRTSVLTNNSPASHLAVVEVLWELKDSAHRDASMRIIGLRLLSYKGGRWRIVAAQDTIARFLPPQNP